MSTPAREEIGSKLSKKFGKGRVASGVSGGGPSGSANPADTLVNTPPPSPEKAEHGKSVRFSEEVPVVLFDQLKDMPF